MVVLTTRKFRDSQKKYFALAHKENVMVKRGESYIHFVVSKKPDEVFLSRQWLKDYMAIPDQYRCDPFIYSPSGDLFWADTRNVERVQKQIDISQQQYQAGDITTCKTYKEVLQHLDSL